MATPLLFASEIGITLGPPLAEIPLDSEVLSLDGTQPAQLLPKRAKGAISWIVDASEASGDDNRNPTLLRLLAFERAAYTVTKGEITKFDSSPGRTRRGFCARCGSTLTCESLRGPLLTETHFHVGAFDRAAELQPTRHVFPEERSPWLPTGD